MEQISRPLKMTEAENRAMLDASMKYREHNGDPDGNRQQRRLAARMARKQRRKEGVSVDE